MASEKCERCWSRKRLVAREVTADERVDPSVRPQTVTLCEHCVDLAPEDALLLWEGFVRLSELGSEQEAFRRLCAEKRFNEHDSLRRARILKASASARPDGEPRR